MPPPRVLLALTYDSCRFLSFPTLAKSKTAEVQRGVEVRTWPLAKDASNVVLNAFLMPC